MWFKSAANESTPLHPTLQTKDIKTVGDLLNKVNEVVEAVGAEGEKYKELVSSLHRSAKESEEAVVEMRLNISNMDTRLDALSRGYLHLFGSVTSAVDKLIEMAETTDDSQREAIEKIAEDLVHAMQKGRDISLEADDGSQ